jgi:hypothetical protein
MAKISRAHRAELQRAATQIRRDGQRARWNVERIAATILTDIPDILPLEAWRLAYGWSRPDTVTALLSLYTGDGLRAPLLNTAMLCRWEHGAIAPSGDYELMLSRLYQVHPAQLGLIQSAAIAAPARPDPRYRPRQQVGDRFLGDGHYMTADNESTALVALRESIQLALEVEGPAGGPLAREQIEEAIGYYALNFSAFAPGHLAVEVHRTRALVSAMLRQPQSDTNRTELRRLAGWLSALVGILPTSWPIIPPRKSTSAPLTGSAKPSATIASSAGRSALRL